MKQFYFLLLFLTEARFSFSFLLENEKQNIETAKSKLSLAMTCALRAAENNKKK
jgi:hypothetical protein